MKFFGWMQSKLNGKQGQIQPDTLTSTHYLKQEPREEFSDWPHGLLAIGTFGNNDLKRDDIREKPCEVEDPAAASLSEDLQDFTPEEVGKLRKELTKLMSRKRTSNVEKDFVANLPLDRFLNCPSSLEVDRRISDALWSEADDKDEDIERTITVLLDRCKDIYSKKSIGKKSMSFILKKMFVCRSGFAPAPSLRDTLQESRLEKLLRLMLHKKIHTQNTSRASSTKKYLEKKETSKERNEDVTTDNRNDVAGSKWVKTDSEYIVLEI